MMLNQVTVPVRDIDASVEFYSKLGLHLIVHTNDHYARFECPGGAPPATFSIHKVETLPAGDGVWVYFEVPDVDAAVEKIKNQGLTMETAPQDQSWLWREARLKDLDGNQIIIYCAGENRTHPPWRRSNA